MRTLSARSALERSWTPVDSQSLYQIDSWGKGYFAVNDRGNMVVRPEKIAGAEIDLRELVETLQGRGLTAPLVVRFSNLLTHRLRGLRDAFASAIAENDYQGRYLAVYPIKVNQQRSVVEEVYRYGREYGFGLEVGSKPELLAVMAMADDLEPRLIICNGFKDDDYIRSVTLAAKLGRNILPVVEKLDELDLILKHAEREGVRPRLGVRIKLAAEGAGRWRGSSGAKSKFGLFVGEVIELARRLEREGLQESLELVHCHPGSQLHDIRRVKDAIGELAHVYAELIGMGSSGLRYLDVGGGLGVDYDGSRTSSASSMNYTLQEYASEVVYRVASVCAEREVPHPILVTESGRALAAYQSMLIVNVLGSSRLDGFEVVEDLGGIAEGDSPQPVLDLVEAYRGLSERRAVECYHDAIQAHEQAQALFAVGFLSLADRGLVERLFWKTCSALRDIARAMPKVPEELEQLETALADIYFCNFSVFQSLPDSWAIDQIFPIVPIHRLDEKPTRTGVLADMTCDSDGQIDRFVGERDIERALPLHELREGEDYYLGVFLTGAYQETLGDLHNLFGDTHVIHVALDGEGRWEADEIVAGDTAAKVLGYLQYDVDALLERLGASCRRAAEEGVLSHDEAGRIVDFYRQELEGYTYLEPENAP
jgi:arginine decarboxylase